MKNKIVLPLIILLLTSCNFSNNHREYFSSWSTNSPTVEALTNYVKEVTNIKSNFYIPYEDRVAVFDMDGTIYSEDNPTYIGLLMYLHRVLDDASYIASQEEKDVANKYRYRLENHLDLGAEFQSDIDKYNFYAFRGLSVEEFTNYAKNFVSSEVDGFKNLTYADAFYKPMLDVIDFLNDNNFTTYLVSASERMLCRALLDGKVNILPEHILGTDVKMKGEFQPDDVEPENYELGVDEKLIRTAEVIKNNAKTFKTIMIANEIGKNPVLAFGNSSGDIPMLNYTMSSPYLNKAFMLVHDDEIRETSNNENANQKAVAWLENGYSCISMKNEFKVVFSENATKNNLDA